MHSRVRFSPLVRHFRGRRFSPAEIGAPPNVQELLKDSLTFTDVHTMNSDDWRTGPYPGANAKKLAGVRKPKILDGSKNSVLLFPGQGAQFVGMGKGLLDYPNVKELYDRASSKLKMDLLQICLEGPQEKLDRTVNCQPAVFVTSLAALERLKAEQQDVFERCIATAGFSVGEYAALVFSGALDFETALEVIQVRADAMQRASELQPSGMLSVQTRATSRLSEAVETAKKWMTSQGYTDPVCSVACFLFSQCKVVAGHQLALDFIRDNAKNFNLGATKRIPVSGAFHTALMDAASDKVAHFLRTTRILEPLIPVYANYSSREFSNVESVIKRNLIRQISRPVKWEQIIANIYGPYCGQDMETFPHTYLLGPGDQQRTILARCNGKAAKRAQLVATV